MKILLNKAHHPVTVLGPGRRIGLWLQGCTIRCHGCISRDTWNADPRTSVEVSDVLDWIRSLPVEDVDGITISGGEPFDQPHALRELLEGVRAWRATTGREIDVLAYSGRRWEVLQEGFGELLDLVDAVLPEPFQDGDPTGEALRGSANQRLIPLTDLGRKRYVDGDPALTEDRRRIQMAVDGESIWFIGIPAQGDMARLRDRARDAGITMRGASWLS